MPQAKILVVEDEEKISRLLELELEFEGYQVTKVEDGITALEKYRTEEWGFHLARCYASGNRWDRGVAPDSKNRPPNTGDHTDGQSSVDDKVTGLDLGANDYVTIIQ